MRIEVAKNIEQLQDALFVRKIVFINEQQVPVEEEIDQYDEVERATHFVMYNDDDKPVGAGRFRKVDNSGKIERICILPEYRKMGAGKELMETIIQFGKSRDVSKLVLGAQTHALTFYEKLGFVITSDIFMDAGIPHKTMELVID
ncbi:GNAT family N-acetyltransferase [Bacillus andreraoultii]|uniref:GNAT family N-acetyltransferase n=1 Tax=Bacillus andreraoultii TaxID=1499685 RepID=UPI0005A9692A|nr:GNAT family N-acetyltransferase [Bacillus andreraoultii]